MTFKEFFQFDELVGPYGSIRQVDGPIGIHRTLRRIHTQTRKKGPSRIKRALAAGKCRSPSRPVSLTPPNTPMTVSSVLENVDTRPFLKSVLEKITKKINEHHTKLSDRYNPTIASLIIGSAIIGSFSPIPGSTFLAALPFMGLGEAINLLKKKPQLLDQIDTNYAQDRDEIVVDLKNLDPKNII